MVYEPTNMYYKFTITFYLDLRMTPSAVSKLLPLQTPALCTTETFQNPSNDEHNYY